ncbi:MAG: zinc ribbon domain-containing protein [Methanobacteriota archaeon]|nr:MAG: zinc ribbon domain-containing protein [Euryarchaeota archaeon]
MSPKKKAEEAACPVCGELVSLEVPSCPKCGAIFEEEEDAQPYQEDEGAECPICGRIVSLAVSSCPYCEAEFDEEEVVAVSEDDSAACPVCGKMVSLTVSSCPNCGAEFEEEEVEEIIEVEERLVPEKARAKEPEPEFAFGLTTSIANLRVLGIAFVILGIMGAQVALLIDWYWTWVPPVEDNLGLFVALPIVVLMVGLMVFMLVKKAMSGGRRVSERVPGMSLSLFVFGILALIAILLWNPINSALRDGSAGVAAGFVVVLVVGIALVFMDMRASGAGSAA